MVGTFEETSHCQQCHTAVKHGHSETTAKYKLTAPRTNMESIITYRERKTNIWIRAKTKVIHMTEQIRRRKWTL